MTQPAASMRPGQSCPGVVQVCDRGRVDRDPGFNEAGAIMPRSGGLAVAAPCEDPRVLQ